MKTYFINLILASIAVLALIKAILLTVGFLIGADMITGIIKAIKTKDPITSKALARTIYKIAGYQLAVISGFLIETYLIPELPLSKLIGGVIAVTELTSIAENVKATTGLDLFSVIKKLQK